MKTLSLSTFVLGTLLALASCGGGTGGTGVGSPAVSVGVMEKGSIILNGVRFEDTTANITIDDTPKTAADLRDGMVVKVRGRINDDRISGKAERVEVENEVRGTVQAVDQNANPPTFTVVGQTVHVPGGIPLANFTLPNPSVAQAIAELLAGINTIVVEVHGLRNTDGSINATRVEVVSSPGADIDELRGTVKTGTLVADTSFTLQNGASEVAVSFSPSTPITPAGATLAEGVIVEVHGNFVASTFNATRIDIEDAEDDEFRHGAGEELHFEGLVSGCPTPCANNVQFFVGTQAAQLDGNTRVEGGTRADIVDNAHIEVEGHNTVLVNQIETLVVEKVEFKRSVIRLQGNVTSTGPNEFALDAGGNSIKIETNDTSGPLPPLPPACIQVRGQLKAGASPVTVTAGEIILSCGNGNRDFIQAPVEDENGFMLTLLGFPIDVSAPQDIPPYQDVNDNELTRDEFFLQVTPATTNAQGLPVPGTLVKIVFEGTAVHQAQIEDED